FFFQAEDGIRDFHVTGVQTCALPIFDLSKLEAGKMDLRLSEFRIDAIVAAQCDMVRSLTEDKNIDLSLEIEPDLPTLFQDQAKEIGRASCREREESAGAARSAGTTQE